MSDKGYAWMNPGMLAACALAAAMALSCLAVGGCAKADEAEETAALVRVEAPGWDAQASSPVILIVVEAGSDEPAFARAVAANADEEICLAAGDYEIEVVSPVNSDGSTYEAIDAVEVSVPAEGGSYALSVALVPVPAEEVSADRMAEVLDGVARAISVGDETLAGEAGRAVVDLATANATVNPVLNAGEIEAHAEAAASAVAGEPAVKPSANAPAATSPSSSSPAQQSPSSGSAPSSKPSTPPASAPSHEHSWTAVTEQRWVVDQAAWEEVTYTDTIHCDCGLTWPSTAAWSQHCEQLALNGGGCGHTVKTSTNVVYHDEVGHYETVTVGYRCSCGATR